MMTRGGDFRRCRSGGRANGPLEHDPAAIRLQRVGIAWRGFWPARPPASSGRRFSPLIGTQTEDPSVARFAAGLSHAGLPDWLTSRLVVGKQTDLGSAGV